MEFNLSKDLSNWMKDLPPPLKQLPITNLAIPGTHDSMTYSMTKNSPMSPDAEPWLQNIKWMGRALRAVIARWSITQANSMKIQLENGIRYFDLRVTTKENSSDIYFCHGLYCGTVKNSFDELSDFLNNHSEEIVILDFQHFYAFGTDDHIKLMKLIEDTFNEKILHYQHSWSTITLDYMTVKNKYQVICIYRSSAGYPTHWPASSFPTPWPQTTSVPQLIAKLNHGITNRDMKTGYVSQCVLTPDTRFVIMHLLGTLKSTCTMMSYKPILEWVNEQSPGNGKLNVMICDFADIDQWKVVKNVIELNMKLVK